MRTFWIALLAITCGLIGAHALVSQDSFASPGPQSAIDTTALTLATGKLEVIQADAF